MDLPPRKRYFDTMDSPKHCYVVYLPRVYAMNGSSVPFLPRNLFVESRRSFRFRNYSSQV
jgi:hypothetical protein